MTILKIDLVSDIACPWYAIGYARLEQALAKLPNISVELKWCAFELNPEKTFKQSMFPPCDW